MLRCVHAESLHDSPSSSVVVDILEHNRCYLNQNPFCEPQLSKYGLAQFRVGPSAAEHRRALLWVLNYSDGAHTLLDIVTHANLRWKAVKHAAQALSARGLLKSADRSAVRSALRKRQKRKLGALHLIAGPGREPVTAATPPLRPARGETGWSISTIIDRVAGF